MISEKEVIHLLKSYERKEKKRPLGPMIEYEVDWLIYCLLNDYCWDKEKIIKKFPALTKGKHLSSRLPFLQTKWGGE